MREADASCGGSDDPRSPRGPAAADDRDSDSEASAHRRFELERGDPALLFETYADDIYRYCRLRGCSPSDAEEVTAQVFEQALDKLPRLLWRRRPVVALLYAIARRRVADVYRGRRHELLVGAVPDHADEPSEHSRLGSHLRAGLAEMPERERLAVVLRIVNGYSFAEVAVAIRSSEKAAKSLVYRGLERLEARLQEEGLR